MKNPDVPTFLRAIALACFFLSTVAAPTKAVAQVQQPGLRGILQALGPTDIQGLNFGGRIPLLTSPCTIAAPDTLALGLPQRAQGDAPLLFAVVPGQGRVANLEPVAMPSNADTVKFSLAAVWCATGMDVPVAFALEWNGRHVLLALKDAYAPPKSLLARDGRGRWRQAHWDSQLRRLGTLDRDAAQMEASVASTRRELRARGWSERVVDAVMAGEIILGMTPAMVVESWGEPEDVNVTVTRSGRMEQWVYGLKSYVYFQNGRVTAWQI